MKNSLIYKASKQIAGGKTINVTIRLDDDCKNGHQDFSITGDIIDNKKRGDNRYIKGGCIHEDIIQHFPDFAPFVRLHICDYAGVPMYPNANLPYHIKEGKMTDAQICEYYRITPEQLDAIRGVCYDKTAVSIKMMELGILEQWKREADDAIKFLEELTGEKFLNDSKKSNFTPPTESEIEEYNKKMSEGYYTPEAEWQRNAQKIEAEISSLREYMQKEEQHLKDEYDVKKQVLRITQKVGASSSVIVYRHDKTIVLNWHKSGVFNTLSDEDIQKIKENLIVPAGYTLK